jgi:hypothetical protein
MQIDCSNNSSTEQVGSAVKFYTRICEMFSSLLWQWHALSWLRFPRFFSASQGQGHRYFTTGDLPLISSWLTTSNFIFQLNAYDHTFYVTSSLTIAAGRRQHSHFWVRVPRDSWLYFTVSDLRLSNLKGQVPVFISPSDRMAQLHPQALGSLFVASYLTQGYGGGIRTRLHTGLLC